MAKIHPTANEGEKRLDDKRGLKDFTAELIKRTERAEQDRIMWLDAMIQSYDRRYSASVFNKPQVNHPWPGASNISIPLSDIHIEELKPPLLNLVFAGARVYEMVPMNSRAVETHDDANIAMDALLKYRMPDYLQQLAWTIDSVGTYGLATNKVFYDYQTQQTYETIRRLDLPPRLAQIAVFKELTPEQRALAQNFGQVLLTRDDFDAREKEFRAVVASEFGLDPEDAIDKTAIGEIMRFLRNGSREAKMLVKRRAVMVDTPRIINRPVENVVVPQGTSDIRWSDLIVDWMFYTENEIKQRARDNVWNKRAVSAALEGGEIRSILGSAERTDQLMWQVKLDRMRMTGPESGAKDGFFRIGEFYTHWDIDNDGIAERVVITMEPKSGAILKAIALPFDHGEWPFIDYCLEATDQERHAARGVPLQINEFERHATALARGELNNLTIETSRSFTYLEGGSINPMGIQWMPNLMIPVASHDDLRPIEMAPRSLALEQPMRNMLSLAERRVSGANRAVLDLPPPERRTATEVNSFDAARQRVMTVRAMLFQEAQKRAGQQIWALWKQYGPDTWYSFVTGKAPIKQTQAQIQGEFLVSPVGAVADLDPNYRAGRAAAMLQMAMQMHPLMGNDPRWIHDIAILYRDWINTMDPMQADRVLRPRDPQRAQMLMNQQQQEAQRAAQIRDIAQRAQANAPISPEEGKMLLNELRSVLPHKDLQTIIAQNTQVVNAARQSAEMAPVNGNGRF